MFIPSAGGRPGTAMTGADGRYELIFTGSRKGAVVGYNKVKISTYFPAMGMSNADGTDVQIPARPERLPKRFHDETELSADVKPGARAYDFDLQARGQSR